MEAEPSETERGIDGRVAGAENEHDPSAAGFAAMLRFAALIVALVAALAAVKREHVLERAGLLGSCTRVAAPGDPTGQWQACHAGRLTGYPDLSRNSCTQRSVQPEVVYWRCPAPLAEAR